MHPHLTNAPITEALLDIHVEPDADMTLARLDEFSLAVQDQFPEKRTIRTIEAEIAVDSDANKSVRRDEVIGYINWNEDKTRAVQGRVNGFSVNHVRDKYTQWNDLRDEAYALWQKYTLVAKPKSIVRCALRYINRIEVNTSVNIDKILKTRIEIAETLPRPPVGFLFRAQLHFDAHIQAILTQAKDPHLLDPSKMWIIFDIDVFSTKSCPVTDDSVWEELAHLRELKNRCFFESLQPTIVEGYL